MQVLRLQSQPTELHSEPHELTAFSLGPSPVRRRSEGGAGEVGRGSVEKRVARKGRAGEILAPRQDEPSLEEGHLHQVRILQHQRREDALASPGAWAL